MRDSLDLYYFQQALDDNILLQIVVVETSKKAWDMLKLEFGVRGSNTNGIDSQITVEIEIHYDEEAKEESTI